MMHGQSNTIEINEYYPFGLVNQQTSSTQFGSKPQNYKTTSKELFKEFNLEGLDFGARMYSPQIGRWSVVDPLAEEMTFWSPYNYAFNNPIKFTDPTGMAPESNYYESTHTDADGNILAVYDDGDLGVYRHTNGETKETLDSKHGKLGMADPTGLGGQRMGETAYWDEFINPNTGLAEGKIEFGKSFGTDIEKLHGEAMTMDLKEIGENSKLYNKFDIKNNKSIAPFGPMTGKLLDGKYATARSAGNYLAGYNGRDGTYFGKHISFQTYMKLAGALQQGKYNKPNAAGIVMFGNQYGPAPWYGEIEYTGRMVEKGWNTYRGK